MSNFKLKARWGFCCWNSIVKFTTRSLIMWWTQCSLYWQLSRPHLKLFRTFQPKFIHTCAVFRNKDIEEKTLYEDLELTSNASSKDIKQAYIDLSKKYHPDLNPDDPEAATRFNEISHAYSVLSKAQLRRKYDRGHLGKNFTAQERSDASHKFDGEAFVDVRAGWPDFKTKIWPFLLQKALLHNFFWPK